MLTTFRHFCASWRVLDVYNDLQQGTFSDLPRRILDAVQISLRDENVHVPDHMHHGRVACHFAAQKSLTSMLLQAVGAEVHGNASTTPLMIHHCELFVRQNQFEAWHTTVLPQQDPVPLLAAAWEKDAVDNAKDIGSAICGLLHTVKHTTLPCVHDMRMHNLLHDSETKQGNLCDLHTHFNGSTEFSFVWLYALQNPTVTYNALAEQYTKGGDKVQYFYKQIKSSPEKMHKLLCRAIGIRQMLCRILASYEDNCKGMPTNDDVFDAIIFRNRKYSIENIHPFHTILPKNLSHVQYESAMWLMALHLLRERRNMNIAMLMHCYMLLTNRYLRLLVQQQEQFGFDQFQYITLMGARDPLEDTNTAQRFEQYKGMYGADLALVEARFSPKKTVEKNVGLLEKIWRDYKKAHFDTSKGICPCVSCPKVTQAMYIKDGIAYCDHIKPCKNPMRLSFIAHFIKQKEHISAQCRHHKLRITLAHNARTLVKTRIYFKKTNPELFNAIVAKDAASNELETPPEVFAPIFRMLNREGLTHTTYHAGEDFEHVLSGIRAVHEAVVFLDMQSGDRIGHATALGIDPELHTKMLSFCARGHWLDDLIWLSYYISKQNSLSPYVYYVSVLYTHIQKMYNDIYKEPCPDLSVLWDAWKMRKLDMTLLDTEMTCLDSHTKIESEFIKKARQKERVFAELKKYHNKKYYNVWVEPISIDSSIISADLLRSVQDAVILELRKKNIAIEVLPTSNVRISHYTQTQNHHVVRWLSQDDTRPIPHVVLGTDDPGIFATNIRNEYAILLNILHKKYPADSERPYKIIQDLVRNGRSYAFTNARCHDRKPNLCHDRCPDL